MTAAKFLIVTAAMTVSAAAFAAGAHSGGHGATSGEPGKVAEVSRTINVAMHDNYYQPAQIAVSPGETLRFVVENKGSLVHEFNIGTVEMHEAHQQEMMMMVEHGIIQGGKLNHEMMGTANGHSMKHDDPNSVLLEPGQKQQLVWKFSEKAAVEFACNVPGHYQAGMHGDVNFE